MGIARKIELYHQALHLARDHIAKDGGLNGRAGLAVRLHDAIRHQLAAGGDDPVIIAAGAIRELQAMRQSRGANVAGAAGVD